MPVKSSKTGQLRGEKCALLLVLGFLLLSLSSCVSFSGDAQKVHFTSASPRWLDLKDAKPIEGLGYLYKPLKSAAGPFPTVIVLHTSLGLGTVEAKMTEELREAGFAVLLVDSFNPRGVHKITTDQTIVSEASILQDLFSSYEYLKTRSDIDENRIAVLGFSKGGLPALYSSLLTVHTRYGYARDPFAAHVAFYPWCGLHFQDMRASGRPVQIHIGEKDEIMPYRLCLDLVEQMRSLTPFMKGEFYVYEGAGHAFDHPYVPSFPFLQVTYKVPKKCRIDEDEQGRFIERYSGIEVTGETFSKAIDACSEKGARVTGDKEAAALAHKRTVDFLKKHLQE